MPREKETDWGVTVSEGDFIRFKAPDGIVRQGVVTRDTPIEAGYHNYDDDNLVIDLDTGSGRHIAPFDVQDESRTAVVSAKYRRREGRPQTVVKPADIVAVSPEGSDDWDSQDDSYI